MASSLLRINQRFPAKSVFSHVFQKAPIKNSFTRCHSIMSISINTETDIQDVLPAETYRPDAGPMNPLILKQREKGDWRFLSMEEKKQIYQLSFQQSICESSADEWKTILAGTFTAMGIMTMGIYIWFTEFGFRQLGKPSLSTGNTSEHRELMSLLSEKMEGASFDIQPRN